MRAVIYARFSSDGQQEESITAQLRACSEFAERNGYALVGEYIDRAFSAKSDKRPEFQRMIAESKQKNFDTVLVHKYDRFARRVYDHAVYEKQLNDNGVQLIAVTENFGTGKESVLMKGLMQSLSEYYILNLSGEVKKGHKEIALQAMHNGGVPPFGYDVVDQKYVVNEFEAHYVRRIFDACRHGDGYRDLLAEMNAAGVTGKRGRQFRYSSIYEILRNEKYTGVYVYCQTENTDREKRRSKDGAIRVENAFPAIIDRAVWEEVQKIMDKRKNTGRASRHEYLLSGVIFCECGASMHGLTTHRKGNEYSYYYCSKKCGTKNIREEDINGAVFNYLRQLMSDDTRQKLHTAVMDYQRQIRIVRNSSVDSIQKEIDEREKQIQNIMSNMSSAVLPPKVLETMGKQIEDLTEQIEILRIEKLKSPHFDKDQVENWLLAVQNLENEEVEVKRMVITHFIKEIVVGKDFIRIRSTFEDLLKSLGVAELPEPEMPFDSLCKHGSVPPQP